MFSFSENDDANFMGEYKSPHGIATESVMYAKCISHQYAIYPYIYREEKCLASNKYM